MSAPATSPWKTENPPKDGTLIVAFGALHELRAYAGRVADQLSRLGHLRCSLQCHLALHELNVAVEFMDSIFLQRGASVARMAHNTPLFHPRRSDSPVFVQHCAGRRDRRGWMFNRLADFVSALSRGTSNKNRRGRRLHFWLAFSPSFWRA